MREQFQRPPREYGILPFWFLNGELDEDEMRWQLRELHDKGMPGVILHGRYGLEMQYIGDTYLDRIALAVEEADRLGMQSWIYDEMNWPSGTADQRVLEARPDLAQRYLQCVAFEVTGPWFACLTGEDSRYLDFERSTPVASFAIGEDGRVIDLTPKLSFEKVLPWQVPPGRWRLMHIVEKRADYYIDALDPEATAEFLRIGYEPYARTANGNVAGFYTDEPAMHYYLSAQDIPIVPWTKDMLRRFRDRCGYELRPKLPHLFADLGPDSAQVRFDFYETTTELYSNAYYRQIADWCRARGVLFTGHLLYEEWLRAMIRAEGNPFRHYRHLDVVGVDHLYPVIGDRDRPAEHIAIKLASSAAHQLGSERLLCESFGGLFTDTTMHRMKWIADWEYVLGVNLLNPHGFHYTLEGPRKRDWPPSMFYQYPWWRHYGAFSDYIGRLSYMLTGGRHVAKVAVLWPMTSLFANYVPHVRDDPSARTEHDFAELTDRLLRLHHDFDYVDDETLAGAEIDGGAVRIGDEAHELVILPPITHIKLAALEQLERFAAAGGRVLGIGFLPRWAFGPDGMVEVAPQFELLPSLDALGAALAGLAHVELDNDELFVLHRVKDGRDVYFVVNPTFEPQTTLMSVAHEAVLWDPSTGEERGLAASPFRLELPPVGSAFVVAGSGAVEHVTLGDPIVLDAEWEFTAPDGNALVIRELSGLVPGTWHHQQPTEPDADYPFAVPYRATFEAEHVPERLDLLIDGFAGSDWKLHVNGEPITAEPRRSRVDSQMKALDIAPAVRPGTNVIALGLTLTRPTDGLLDPLKLIGDFALVDGVMHEPGAAAEPADWTRQGYPFYSGCGVYRAHVDGFEGRARLEADAGDDVLEVVVNGTPAGVRLWPPYALDVTLAPGENELELRVFNTPANLLEGQPRRSGLTGPPRLIPYAPEV